MTDKNEKRVRIAITNRDDDEPEVTQDEVSPEEQKERSSLRQPFDRAQDKTQDIAEDELEAIRQEAAEYKDKYLRAAAELENTKKRLERRYAGQAKEEKKRLLRAFLAVADNLERALAHSGDDGLRDGVKLTHQELQRLLSQEGVEPLEAVGQPFDPYYHEAVDTVAGDHDQETVVGERQKGYLYRGELLRPAKVEVAIPSPKES
jgi:molecular chaperone GrpE